MVEEGKPGGIFSGRTAWFSKSISPEVRKLWVDAGGMLRGCQSAQYLFSGDSNANDTIGFYLDQHQNSRVIIFTSEWITDAVKTGKPCEIACAHYILEEPSREVSEWDFLDQSGVKVRSLKEFRQLEAKHRKPPHDASGMSTKEVGGIIHIDEIDIGGTKVLRDFVPNRHGFEVLPHK